MNDVIRCPDCGATTPPDAAFCPGCGRPRTYLKDELARESLASGVSFTDLLDRARAEDLENEPVALTLARLERRLNEIESGTRRAPSYHAPAQTTVTRPAHAESTQPAEVPPAPAAPIQAPPPVATGPEKRIDIEELITGRVLAWVGGLAIALGAAFFLSLAFSNGWIGPAARVVIGVVASLMMLAGGAFFFERREALFGHVLTATALGIMSLSLLAATRLYEFIAPQIGVLAALGTAAIAATIAIRAGSQVVAAFGIVTALAAPLLVDAAPSYLTLAFIGVALAGAVAISFYQEWRWLPVVAFLFSAPQAADYLTSEAGTATALIVLTGFWALYVLSSGGEEFRRETGRLSLTSTGVMVANATFVVLVGMEILSGEHVEWRGLFLVGVALAHGLFGGYFLYTRQLLHPFGMLIAAMGVGALTLAIPVQFGGPVVPMLWAVLATALVWIYAKRGHVYSGGLALLLGVLALGHLLRVEYPLRYIPDGVDSAWPYINSSGGALGFLLVALALAWYMVGHPLFRSLLVVTGAGLIALSAPFEVRPAVAVLIWATLAAGLWLVTSVSAGDERPFLFAARAITGAGIAWTVLDIARPTRLFIDETSTVDHPLFWSGATLALLGLITSMAVGFYIRVASREGRILGIMAAALGVYLLSVGIADQFQSMVGGETSLASLQKQSQVALSILWASLGILTFVLGLVRWGVMVRSFGLALLALATVKVFIYDLASLDTSYRVLSFIGLGMILLASSFAYQHYMPMFERQSRSEPPLGGGAA